MLKQSISPPQISGILRRGNLSEALREPGGQGKPQKSDAPCGHVNYGLLEHHRSTGKGKKAPVNYCKCIVLWVMWGIFRCQLNEFFRNVMPCINVSPSIL